MREFAGSHYGRVARAYDTLVWFSGRGIPRSRNWFLGRLPLAPRNPLIVGCGTGVFPAAFVRSENPPRLTINDLAPEMIELTQRRILENGWKGELRVIAGDAADIIHHGEYDLIVMQYVLTCFDQQQRVRFLKRVKQLLAPGGFLWISDYARPRSRWMLPWFYLNYWAAVALLAPLAGTPVNLPADMDQAIVQSGLDIEHRQSFAGGLYSAWLTRIKEPGYNVLE